MEKKKKVTVYEATHILERTTHLIAKIMRLLVDEGASVIETQLALETLYLNDKKRISGVLMQEALKEYYDEEK